MSIYTEKLNTDQTENLDIQGELGGYIDALTEKEAQVTLRFGEEKEPVLQKGSKNEEILKSVNIKPIKGEENPGIQISFETNNKEGTHVTRDIKSTSPYFFERTDRFGSQKEALYGLVLDYQIKFSQKDKQTEEECFIIHFFNGERMIHKIPALTYSLPVSGVNNLNERVENEVKILKEIFNIIQKQQTHYYQ